MGEVGFADIFITDDWQEAEARELAFTNEMDRGLIGLIKVPPS